MYFHLKDEPSVFNDTHYAPTTDQFDDVKIAWPSTLQNKPFWLTMKPASAAWNMQKDMRQLATVQRRAARFSWGDYNYRTPGYVKNILKTIYWVSLHAIRKNNRLCLSHNQYRERWHHHRPIPPTEWPQTSKRLAFSSRADIEWHTLIFQSGWARWLSRKRKLARNTNCMFHITYTYCEELVIITMPRINRPARTTNIVQFSMFRSHGQLFFKWWIVLREN